MLIHTLMFLGTRLKHKILKRIYELILKVCSITETKNKCKKVSSFEFLIKYEAVLLYILQVQMEVTP